MIGLDRAHMFAEGTRSFIQRLMQGLGIGAAWTRSVTLPVRCGYRLHKRLQLIQSVLRTHLYSRAPPPTQKKADSPLYEVFDHLKEAFDNSCAVSAYQETLQREFLGLV
jgi:hypothetical protein